MNGAIFYSGRYGSTEEYSQWIGEETGLPAFHVDDPRGDPARYDFVVLGSSVVFYKATIRDWVERRWPELRERLAVLFTVSGAPPGPKVDRWVDQSFPGEVLEGVERFALRGRLRHEDVIWWLRLLLKMGALMNRDPDASHDEMHGFDYVDRTTIAPIVEAIERLCGGVEDGVPYQEQTA